MSGPAVFGPDVYAAAVEVEGRVVVVLRGHTDRRGLQLTPHRSRAVLRHAIHELMVTDESAEPGDSVNRVGLIGFFEVSESAVILLGSRVYVGERPIGTVAGFDETHMPNHLNICLAVDELIDGERIGVQLNDRVRFVFDGS
jgi:hypothetical protein